MGDVSPAQAAQLESPPSPRLASTAPCFEQVVSRDVSALPGASCVLPWCYFLNDPGCKSSSQFLTPSAQEEREHLSIPS